MASDQDEERESRLLSTEVDPVVRAVLDAADPWDAYKAANDIPDSLVDELDWMPHGGSLYTAWAELTDLFETGKTPIPDAHAALRQAATSWLARTGQPTAAFLEMWLERTRASINAVVLRDGNFWHDSRA
jgi:hypothetical protein